MVHVLIAAASMRANFSLGAQTDTFQDRCLCRSHRSIKLKLLLQTPLHVYLSD